MNKKNIILEKNYQLSTKYTVKNIYKVIKYANGVRVEVPLHPDGSIRWFDDSKLIKH